MGSIKIAPSILSADMANLKGELDKIAGADGGASGVEHMLIPGVLVEGDTVRDLR